MSIDYLAGGIPSIILDANNIVNSNVNSWPEHMPLPYTYKWNLNVQRELGAFFTAQVGYVGSIAHDLYVDPYFNQPQLKPGAIGPRMPFPQYSSILAFLPLDRSNYNSLNMQVEQRFRKGFSLLGSYTWSHSLDYAGQTSDRLDYSPQNPWSNYASSNFDVRQRLAISYIYELPFDQGKLWANHGVGGAVLGGWQLSGVVSVQTGIPITPILSFDPSNTGAAIFPNVVPGAALYPANQGPDSWFKDSAFVVPPAYTYGNAGRNIPRGRGLHSRDAGLQRSVSIQEKFAVQFTAEVFDKFNTPQFGLPANQTGVSNSDVIKTVSTPERHFQLGLHLGF